MANQPLVSIVVPCYNSGRYIHSALDSVLNQTYANIECIVVDDGSTDNTKDIVLEFLERDTRLKYFYKANGGEASAKNYGLERANGEWVHVLDADDWIANDKIANQVKAGSMFSGNDAFVLVYSDYGIVYQNERTPNPKNIQVIVGELSRQQIVHRIVSRKTGLSTPTPITLNSMLLSRNIFAKYKMNEEMPNIADLELYYRILQEEVCCIYMPGISMYYRQHDTNISKESGRSLLGYTMFLNTIYSINKNDLAHFPNLQKMLRQSVILKDRSVYERLVHLMRNSAMPVYANLFGRELNVRSLYRALARLNLLGLWIKASATLGAAKNRLSRAVNR
jgi:glycosyltransferase involved in cell wall biosynthesis